MSVSNTNLSDPRVPSGVLDGSDGLLPQTPPPISKKSTSESRSKLSIDALLCSSGPTSGNSQTKKRIANANASSTSILKPSMVSGIPNADHNQPLPMGVRPEPLPSDVSFPFSSGIAPTAQSYPSSYPVLKNYPIPPSQPHDLAAIAPQAGFYTMHIMPTMPEGDPTLTPISYGSLVLTQPPFHLAFDLRQPATNTRQSTSLPSMGEEPPAKRRRIGEGGDSTAALPSELTAELPIWHESKIVPDEDPTPYMEFLGLIDDEGKNFVKKIFNYNQNFLGERFDFLKKLFTHLSEALEKRQDGITQISDDQVGKLIVASFLLTRKISRYYDRNTKKTYSVRDIANLVISFINTNHCVVSYLKGGLQLNSGTSYLLFSGKHKAELMLWCAEQSISLNQEELEFLQTHQFKVQILEGRYLLKELRDRVKERSSKPTS